MACPPNSGSWNRIFGLVFLDNPIGTRFSIAAKPEEIPRDQISVARDLFVAITKFIELDPVFKSWPLYITGVNLGGVAIGDGFTYPEIQVATHEKLGFACDLKNWSEETTPNG
ncbi:hypothetical protein CerSpe_074600 [Prunus speciosa]